MGIFKKYEDGRVAEISVNTPKKHGAALYFELFLRKFWNYVKLNLLYFGTSLVTIAIYWFVLATVIVPIVMNTLDEESWKVMADASGNMPVESLKGSIVFFVSLLVSLLVVTLFGGGVFSSGYNYVLRNYVREENAFLFSDYFEQTKKNLGQALAVSIIDKIVICVCLFSMASYYAMMKTGGGFKSAVAFALMLFVFFVYAAMHTYVWTVMVTFKVSVKQIYKNSMLLTFGSALRSIGYIAGAAAFCVVMTVLFAYFWIAALGIFLLIGMAAFNLAGSLSSYPVIKKYMMDNNN